MLEVTFAQLQTWLALFLWPFARISAFVMAAPLLGHSSVPAQAKVGFSVLLTFLVSSTLPALPEVPVVSWAGFGILVEQMVVGVALGVALHIMFTGVQLAGEFIGLKMGLSFATFFTPDSGNTMILARWLYMITLLMFLAFDGHLLMIAALAQTFETLPVGLAGLNADGFELLARFAGTLFVTGLVLSLPLVGAVLVINVALGILNRAAPQFTVFSVGFPMSLTTGLFLMTLLMNDLSGFLLELFNQGLSFMRSLAPALAP